MSRLEVVRRSIASRVVVLALACLCWPLSSNAQEVCDSNIKEQVARQLSEIATLASSQDRLEAEAKLYKEFSFCLQVEPSLANDSSFDRAAAQCGAKVSQRGSLYFEEMSCCGYDPQRRQFACPVRIKQRFGFGGAPLPGSREHVLHCVADASGNLQPVGVDSVHLANELFGNGPSWQFAVIAAANENLHTVQPMSGQTRRARSILSWGFQPTGCNFQPIWGNALNYTIRLDQ